MIHEELTIVIPHKNDAHLNQMLVYLSTQNNIQDTRVIIADNSDIENSNIVLEQFVDDFKDTLKIEIIKGGFPSRARYNGAKLVKTKYVLFLDSDIFLYNKNTVTDIYNELVLNDMQLVTTKIRSSEKIKHIDFSYKTFDIFRNLLKYTNNCFAVGGVMAFKMEIYREIGGFDPEHIFAEDFAISRKIIYEKFKVLKTKVYTPSRRFKKTSLLKMFFLMINTLINRNDNNFYKGHFGYQD